MAVVSDLEMSKETFASCDSRPNTLSTYCNKENGANIAYLKHISAYADKDYNDLITLSGTDEISLGRWPAADIFLTKTDTMISRKHATVRFSGSTWFIKDHESVNGVFLNGSKLVPNFENVLNDKDEVQFGVQHGPGMPSRYVYRFCTSILLSNDETDSLCDNSRSTKRVKFSGETSPNINMFEKSNAAFQKELQHRESEAEEKMKAAEQQLKKLQEQLLQKELVEAKIIREMKEREDDMKKQLLTTQTQRETEKKILEDEIRSQYEKELKEKEESLIARLSAEKNDLMSAKLQIEKNLQDEMERKLEEKDLQLQNELLKEKQRLIKVIETKELEQKMLQSELSETKAENLKQKADALCEKESVLMNITNLLETELQCAICNELFIEAVSLNCSHSFCKACIEEWKKKKPECPICRGVIVTCARSLVLDNYIDRMLEHLSDDLREERKLLISSRKELQSVSVNKSLIMASANVRVHPSSAAARGRGQQRTARGDRRNQRNQQPATIPATTTGPRTGASVSSVSTVSVRNPLPGTSIANVPSITNAGNSGAPSIVPGHEVPIVIGDEVVISNTVDDPVVVSSEDYESDDNDTNDSDNYSMRRSRRRRRRPRRYDDDEDENEDENEDEVEDEEDSDASVPGSPNAPYGGYGHCYSCGRRGHWAPGCPF